MILQKKIRTYSKENIFLAVPLIQTISLFWTQNIVRRILITGYVAMFFLGTEHSQFDSRNLSPIFFILGYIVTLDKR